MNDAEVWQTFQDAGIDSLSTLIGYTGTQPAIQFQHIDYADWSSLTNTGVEAFYAQLASEAYKTTQSPFLTHQNVGDFRLTRGIGHTTTSDHLCVYEEITSTTTSAKKIIFSLKGSNSLWDYAVDGSLLHDYSVEGVSTVFDNLYDYLLEQNYQAVLSYITGQDTPTLHQYYLVGHSLGGTLARDIHAKLVDNNYGGNVESHLFNPYTLLTERYVDTIQEVQNAVDGVTGFGRFMELKLNMYNYICRGDIFAAAAIWHAPGSMKTFPAKEVIANVDDLSISNILWNAGQERLNHKLLNFYEAQPYRTTLQLISEKFTEGKNAYGQTIQVPFNGAIVNAFNKTLRDFTGVRASVGEHHVKLRAQTVNFADIKANVFYGAAVDRQDYSWEFSQVPNGYHCYDDGHVRHVTPVYTMGNEIYNVSQTVFVRYHHADTAGVDYYFIVKLGTNHAFVDSNSVVNVPAYTINTISANLNTGVPVDFKGYAQSVAINTIDGLDRRLFSFMRAAETPDQGEGEVTWLEDETRRMIHSSLANPLTDHLGVTIGVTLEYLPHYNWTDNYPIEFYLNDVGNGLKWGHTNTAGQDNYKILLEETSTVNQYYLKGSSYNSATAMYVPTYEIEYVSGTQYMIKALDILNNGKYLKHPTKVDYDWTHTLDDTISMIKNNDRAEFIPMTWATHNPLTQVSTDFIFDIEKYADIKIPSLKGNSMTNIDADGNIVEKHLAFPDYLRSSNGVYTVQFTRLGLLQIYSTASINVATISSSQNGNQLTLQTDANVVVWDGGTKPTTGTPWSWQAGVQEHPNNIVTGSHYRKILITDTGVFQILDINANVLASYS